MIVNTQIAVSSLPKAEGIPLEAIDRRYLAVIAIRQGIFWSVVFTIALLSFIFIEGLQHTTTITVTGLIIFLVAAASIFLSRKSFHNKAFALREHDILYQTGWIIKTLHVCPLNRVQHCSIDSGIIERKYGLATLNIFTAGGDESDISIPGLPAELAGNLRQAMLGKTK